MESEVTPKQLVRAYMLLFPEVQWDRWTGDPDTWMSVFGWIDRPDKYKDYLYLSFTEGFLSGASTSSAKYSATFAKRLGSPHLDCKRVEHDFDIPNCIKLEKKND